MEKRLENNLEWNQERELTGVDKRNAKQPDGRNQLVMIIASNFAMEAEVKQ